MCNIIPQYMIQEILLNSTKQSTMVSFMDALSPQRPATIGLMMDEDCGPSPQVKRTIYDAEEKTRLPGKVVREEGGEATKDEIEGRAYDFSGNTWDFFKKIFGRNSIDNKGFPIHSTIHYGKNYPNAFWDNRGIVFGDGDKKIFMDFVLLDIVGHEISHGLTSRTANLEYYSEPGSINEHFSDVFGMAIKQWVLGENNKTSSWIVGEGIFNPSIKGLGIRSMKSPGEAYNDPDTIGRDKQPAHYKDKYTGPEDQQGVHWNSGILNKIFYEYCINTGANSFDGPAKIWYNVLTKKLHRKSNFHDFVNATQEVIIQSYGTGDEYKSFKEAAASVGLRPRHPIFHQMGI